MKYYCDEALPRELNLGKLVLIYFDPKLRRNLEGKAYLKTIGDVTGYHEGQALRKVTVQFYGETNRLDHRVILTDEMEGN